VYVGLLGLVYLSETSRAATYHVAVNGNNANNGSEQSPWRTIDYAADRVVAGDTVIVRPGRYNETVTPSVSGTTGSPVTFYGGGTATTTTWVLNAAQHIRIVGFVVDRAGGNDCIDLINSHFIEVWNCTFYGSARNSIVQDGGSKASVGNNSLFIGNRFYAGVEARFFAVRGNNNLVEYNEFNGANEDYIYWFGVGNILRNNYAHSPNPVSTAHVDFFQTGTDAGVGNHYTTIEANFYVDSDIPSDHHHFSNMSNGGSDFTHVLLRRNIAHQIGTGTHNIFENWANVYMLHESYLQAMRVAEQANTRYGVVVMSSVENPRVFNSIAWKLWGANATSVSAWTLEGTGAAHNFNLGFDPDRTVTFIGDFGAEANSLRNTDPRFGNYANDDFSLQLDSPAIGAAGPPTRVTSASGSGTTFTVGDAGFFRGDNTSISQYGGNLVIGDTITVGTDVLTITSISGNNITVTTNFTWANNDPVYWGDDAAPDIGAYPYSAAGFGFGIDISSHANGQLVAGLQTLTATVSNPGAMRHVVFFVNGIPAAVDNQSPYSFAWNPSGLAEGSQHRIEARAYARYASKQLTQSDSVLLTIGNPGHRPDPPEALRVVPPQ